MVPKRKKIAMYAAMIIITAIVVFPFLWMVLLSFKSSSEIMSNPLAMPKAFNLDNFKPVSYTHLTLPTNSRV